MNLRFVWFIIFGLSVFLVGCIIVVYVMLGVDVFWKDDVIYDGDGFEYLVLLMVLFWFDDVGVEIVDEEFVEIF